MEFPKLFLVITDVSKDVICVPTLVFMLATFVSCPAFHAALLLHVTRLSASVYLILPCNSKIYYRLGYWIHVGAVLISFRLLIYDYSFREGLNPVK